MYDMAQFNFLPLRKWKCVWGATASSRSAIINPCTPCRLCIMQMKECAGNLTWQCPCVCTHMCDSETIRPWSCWHLHVPPSPLPLLLMQRNTQSQKPGLELSGQSGRYLTCYITIHELHGDTADALDSSGLYGVAVYEPIHYSLR